MDETCFHWKLFTRIERGDVTAQTVVQISGIRACTMEQPQHAVKNDIIVHPVAYFMANGPHDLDFDALCSIVEPIAKKYGMSEGQIRAIISRTKQKLKAYLEKEDFYI